jgi:hypothetical protein
LPAAYLSAYDITTGAFAAAKALGAGARDGFLVRTTDLAGAADAFFARADAFLIGRAEDFRRALSTDGAAGEVELFVAGPDGSSVTATGVTSPTGSGDSSNAGTALVVTSYTFSRHRLPDCFGCSASRS